MMRKYMMSIIILFTCSVILIACNDGDNTNNQHHNGDDENIEQNNENIDANNDNSQNENVDTQDNNSNSDNNSETDGDTASNKAEDGDEKAYELYANGRFGFSVEYPSSFEADYMPANNDGIEVHDDTAVIIASGSHGSISLEDGYTTIQEAESIETFYDKAISDLEAEGYSISYERLDGDRYVISYIDESNIVYEKSIMGDDFIANLFIEYPSDLRDEYDPIVERVSGTFSIP